MWQHLGRQGGGGGSRANKGEGEKQIELDRRQISHRITELKKELAAIDHTRDVQRQGRKRDGYPQVALVGYTNAGKSTLMNHLIGMSGSSPEHVNEKQVFEKDMLFATLDTSIRKIDIPGRKPFLLSDTVGFIEPYTSGELINRIHRDAVVLSESYEEDGLHIVAECDGNEKGAVLLAELLRIAAP